MAQFLIPGFGYTATLTVSSPGLNTSVGWGSTTQDSPDTLLREPGTADYLQAVILTNTTTGSTASTIAVGKNGAATGVSVSVPAGTTGTFEDSTHSVAFSSGDYGSFELSLKTDGSGNTFLVHVLTVRFTPSDPSVVGFWGTTVAVNALATDTVFFANPVYGDKYTESDRLAIKTLAAFTARKFFVNIGASSGGRNLDGRRPRQRRRHLGGHVRVAGQHRHVRRHYQHFVVGGRRQGDLEVLWQSGPGLSQSAWFLARFLHRRPPSRVQCGRTGRPQ